MPPRALLATPLLLTAAAGMGAIVWMFGEAIWGALPGITTGPAGRDLVWGTFWASLMAGVIVSGVVGLAVALFLTWWQDRIALRRERHSAERDISAFKEQARFELRMPSVRKLHEDTRNLAPKPASAIVELLNAQPLAYWEERVPTEERLFGALRDLRDAYVEFIASGSYLAGRYVTLIRAHHTKESPNGRTNIGPAVLYCVGRSVGMSPEERLAILGLTGDVKFLYEMYIPVVDRLETDVKARHAFAEADTRLVAALAAVAIPLQEKRH